MHIKVYIAVTGGADPKFMWALVDCMNAIPTFINIVTLLILYKIWIKRLNDYKARYLGVGTVDPSFKAFYDAE